MCTIAALELKDFNILRGIRIIHIQMLECRRQNCNINPSWTYGNNETNMSRHVGRSSIVDKASAYDAKGPKFTTQWMQQFINL